MRVAIWKTNHEIADTVADALGEGLAAQIFHTEPWSDNYKNYLMQILPEYDAHIGYGILRNMDKVFKECGKPWFNIDNSYWGAGHFHGNYRISFKGTQSKYDAALQKPHDLILEPWKTMGDTILIVPPSEYVCEFFNVTGIDWYRSNFNPYLHKCVVRTKDTKEPIDWKKIKGVVTFNSTVGVEALRRGVPVISDTEHSMIGSYYKQMLLDKGLDYSFENITLVDRESLFCCMASHQFTLEELREGKAWNLLQFYLNSAST